MKLTTMAFIGLCGLLLILVPMESAVAQERTSAPQTAAGDVEVLRRQVEEQKGQILQLKTSLLRQSEQQERQQHLLDALQQRLEQLAASAPVPAAGETPAIPRTPQSAAQAEQVPAEQVQKVTQPETVTAKTEDVRPNGVEVGIGKIKFNGLLQTWFLAGNGGLTDTFRIRRAELKFTGEISPHFKWTVMIDPAKSLSLNNAFTTVSGTTVLKDTSVNQASRILQDAFITLSYFKRANINAGQFKVPLSLLMISTSWEAYRGAPRRVFRSRGTIRMPDS